jgi:hypothetical protein
MPRPKKIDWAHGIGFEEMLRVAMPMKRLEDRFKFYRLYLRDTLHRGWPATEQEIDEAFAKASTMKFPEAHVAQTVITINYQMGIWQREIRRNKAKMAAATRWKK